MTVHVLLVDDDSAWGTLAQRAWASQGYSVQLEVNLEAVADRLRTDSYDAVIVSVINLEEHDWEIMRAELMEFEGRVFVLYDEARPVNASVMGPTRMDAHWVKPKMPAALTEKLQSVLPIGARVDRIVGELTIHQQTRSVTLSGDEIGLTIAEYELLTYLADRAGQVVDRQQLYLDLLQIPYDGLDRSIDLRVSRLRRKLRDDPQRPRIIESIRGVGYRLATGDGSVTHSRIGINPRPDP
ncbi:MAG: response regulator transcription factor [Planctomycetota bacterium]